MVLLGFLVLHENKRIKCFYYTKKVKNNMIILKSFCINITTLFLFHSIKFYFQVCFAVLQTFGCVFVILTVHYVGKRFLTLSSVSVNSISILLFGVYAIAKDNNYFASTPGIPITLLCIISFFGGFISTLPWMLLSEIFPNK